MTPDPLTWRPHPDAWLLVVALAGAYLYALSAWGPTTVPGRRAATRRQRACFLGGVAVLWLGADWPLDALSSHWFSAHMVQHLLFTLVAAPLLILGTPGWLLRRLLRRPALRSAVRGLTQPLVALLIVNGWIVLYHWPAVVNLSVRNDLFHFAVHVVWVAVGLVLWWPVLSPLPELPHLSYPGRMAYLFGNSLVPTVPASFLTYGETVIYRAYEEAPRVLNLSPLDDQLLAGLIMKVAAGFFLWIVIAALFFRWQREEETGAPDILYWRDLAPELETSSAPR